MAGGKAKTWWKPVGTVLGHFKVRKLTGKQCGGPWPCLCVIRALDSQSYCISTQNWCLSANTKRKHTGPWLGGDFSWWLGRRTKGRWHTVCQGWTGTVAAEWAWLWTCWSHLSSMEACEGHSEFLSGRTHACLLHAGRWAAFGKGVGSPRPVTVKGGQNEDSTQRAALRNHPSGLCLCNITVLYIVSYTMSCTSSSLLSGTDGQLGIWVSNENVSAS